MLITLPSGHDLNIVRNSGDFFAASPQNGPSGVSGFLRVDAVNYNGNRRVIQKINDIDTGAEHYRAFTGGAWTAWTERGAGGGGGGITATAGAPDDGDGADDDVRIDPETGNVYQKIAGSWDTTGNMFTAQDDAFWTMTIKGLNTVRNNTDVLAADPELKFNMEANRLYRFRFNVYYETGSTPDFKFSLNGPASPDKIVIFRKYVTPNTSSYAGIGTYTSYSGPFTAINGTGGTQGLVFLEGIIENGPNAGDVEFLWAQNTATVADTIVLRGSYVEFKDHLDV